MEERFRGREHWDEHDDGEIIQESLDGGVVEPAVLESDRIRRMGSMAIQPICWADAGRAAWVEHAEKRSSSIMRG